MSEQRDFVDFNQGLGDTGQNNLASIQPFNDGEGATQVVLRRSPENLRTRTEVVRDQVQELLYYRDYSHLMIEYSGGSIIWNGTSIATNGVINVSSGTFKLSPMLAPSAAKKGTLTVGGANQVIYTVAAQAYAADGMNAITVTHIDGGPGATAAATITAGPVKRIVVIFDSINVAHTPTAIKTLLDAAILSDTDLTGKLGITTAGTGIVAAIIETRIEGTADDESHFIAATDIRNLTIANPLSAGKGIAIWYRYVIEPVGFTDPKGVVDGGRAQSTASRTAPSNIIPAASLFITNIDPTKIPGAIPICRVGHNGQLIWYDGTRQESGETITFASPTSVAATAVTALAATLTAQINLYSSQITGQGSALIGYDGGPAWKDATTNPATTVQNQLDKIVTDLIKTTADSGAAKLGLNITNHAGALTATGGGGLTAAADNPQTALDQVDNALVARRGFTAVITDGVNSVGGDFNTGALFTNINSFGSGRYTVRRGSYSAVTTIGNNISYSVLGEYASGIDITNNASADISIDGANADTKHHFEDVTFRTQGVLDDRFVFENGIHVLKNCRAEIGIIKFNAGSIGNSVSIDHLLLSTANDSNHTTRPLDIALHILGEPTKALTGTIKELQLDAVCAQNNAANYKYGLKVEDLVTNTTGITYNREALVYDSCKVDIITGFGVAGGVAFNITNSYQPQIFRGCVFRQGQASATAGCCTLIDCGNITFEDCIFIQDGNGTTLDVSGNSFNVQFRNCSFYTSPTAINADEFHVISTASPYRKAIKFQDCHLEIRRGDGTLTRRIEFGTTLNTAVGTGSIAIDGLSVYLNYSNTTYLNDRLFQFEGGAYTAPSYQSGALVRNLRFDFNSKQVNNDIARVVQFAGASTSGTLWVEGLYLNNVVDPDTMTASSSLVSLVQAGIRGGEVNGATSAGLEGWDSIILLAGNAPSCQGMRFWANNTVNRGRLFSVTGRRSKILDNECSITDLAPNETLSGWWVVSYDENMIFSGNTLVISGTSTGAITSTPSDSIIQIVPAATYNSVTHNMAKFSGGPLCFVYNQSDYCDISHNIFQSNDASSDATITLTNGDYNMISHNININSGAGTSSIDMGSGTGNLNVNNISG